MASEPQKPLAKTMFLLICGQLASVSGQALGMSYA